MTAGFAGRRSRAFALRARRCFTYTRPAAAVPSCTRRPTLLKQSTHETTQKTDGRHMRAAAEPSRMAAAIAVFVVSLSLPLALPFFASGAVVHLAAAQELGRRFRFTRARTHRECPTSFLFL
jgi:hypothetical protein